MHDPFITSFVEVSLSEVMEAKLKRSSAIPVVEYYTHGVRRNDEIE